MCDHPLRGGACFRVARDTSRLGQSRHRGALLEGGGGGVSKGLLLQPCARKMADACGSLVAVDIAIQNESPCSIVPLYSIVASMYVWFVGHWFALHICGRLELGGDELYTPQRFLRWTEAAVICAVFNTRIQLNFLPLGTIFPSNAIASLSLFRY